MKIHVLIAQHSKISRREAERLVASGAIIVDGEVAHVGQVVDGSEKVEVNGIRLKTKSVAPRLLLLNKAEGVVCSHQNEGNIPSVLEGLPKLGQQKWLMVGRLDVNTSGLLMITNNGKIAHHFAHPSNGYKRVYLVRINGLLTAEMLKSLRLGIQMDEGLAKFEKIEHIKKKSQGLNQWYRVVLKQGRYRMVRRMIEAVGFEVSRLKRVQFGPFVLDQALGKGKYQEVSAQWLEQYLAQKKV
ncbi:rRNA pseudouridine synthase [Gammaproteobacteria bacterium]|nr:rRNA pseudouridine synthase [Gammaproteobacteria bacterium]